MMTSLRAEFLNVLAQLDSFLRDVPDPLYRATALESGRISSIGAHVRHILDHLEPLTKAFEVDAISYDRRKRDPAIEQSSERALEHLRGLRREVLAAWNQCPADRPLRLESVVAEDEAHWLTAPTSLSRELLFVVSHSVHHMALIKFIARDLGHELPEDFGKAIATRAYERRVGSA